MRALDAFLRDAYGERKIVDAGKVPLRLIEDGSFYEPDMQGLDQPVWAGFAGLDVIRDGAGEFRVLEDNLRMPTGIGFAPLAWELVGELLGPAVPEREPADHQRGARALRGDPARGWRRATTAIPRWSCSATASRTTRSGRSPRSRSAWACRWSRSTTSATATAAPTRASTAGAARSTSSTGARTTTCCARRTAARARSPTSCSSRCGAARWRSSTRPASGSPTTSSPTSTCRR